jgi:hypothetical protein
MAQHSFWSDVQLTSASKERSDGEGGGAGCNQSINDGGNCRLRVAGSGFSDALRARVGDGYELLQQSDIQIGPVRAVMITVTPVISVRWQPMRLY